MFFYIKWPLRLNQIIFDHLISVAPCIFDKQGVGVVVEKTKKLKGFMRFLGAVVQSVFHGNGALYKNSDQLWLFYCIKIRRVFREHFEPSASC